MNNPNRLMPYQFAQMMCDVKAVAHEALEDALENGHDPKFSPLPECIRFAKALRRFYYETHPGGEFPKHYASVASLPVKEES